MKTDKSLLFLSAVFLIVSATWFISCTHKADLSNIPEVCFERDVLPIFLNSCATTGCHDGTGEGMILTDYNNILRGVIPGNPNSSRIYRAITTTTGENKMPPLQPLTLENRVKIRLWIEQGAPDSSCPPQ